MYLKLRIMAKVSNQDIYNQDDNLSMEDYLLGTNTNTINKKTQTYSLGSIFSLFYNFLGFNAFLFTTDTTTYPIGTPGCFFVFDEEDNLTNDFTESRKITFSATDTYNFNVAEYFGIVVNSGKFLFKLINLEDKNNFIFLKPSNFVLGGTGTTFNVDVLAESGLSNGSFVNYKRYLLVLEFAAGTFDPADYDLSDFTNTSGNPFITAKDLTDALALLPTPIRNHSGLNLDDITNPHRTTKQDVGLSNVPNLDTTEAVNNEHTHSNKTILDNTTESFITALKNAYDGAVSWITTNGTNLINHLSNNSNPHNVTKSQVGLSNVDNTSDVDKPISTATQVALNDKLDKSTTPSSVYTTDAGGLQVMKPLSDFKDVLDFADFDAFPTTGETGKIYLALDTNFTYRWGGSAYVQIGGREIYIQNISVSGGYTVDFNVDTHRLTLIGNTTFSEINLPALGFSKTITLHINGNFGVVFPASWTQYISGAYKGTATLNTIVVEAFGSFRKVQISQPD